MSIRLLVQGYIDRAREAERLAAAVTSPDLKVRWLGIAQGYRSMAQQHLDRVSPNPLAEPPQPALDLASLP